MSRPEQIYILEPTSSNKMPPLAGGISSRISTDLQTSPSLCRICASSTKLVLPIFEQEGLENNLAEKIQKYLPIQISQNDLLPKVVCYQCTTTILTWHELVTTCQQADTTLRNQMTLRKVKKGSENAYSDNMSKSNTTVSFIEAVKEIILSIFSSVMEEEDCGIEFVCTKCNNEHFCDIEDLSEHLVSIHILHTSSRITIKKFIKDHIRFEESFGLNDSSIPCNPSRSTTNSDAIYSCKLCEGLFTSTIRLIGHLHEHTAVDFEAGVTCCGCVYSEREALVLHVRGDHRAAAAPAAAAAAAAACRSCGQVARDAAALRAHVLAEHVAMERTTPRALGPNNQKRIPAACPICRKTFSNKYNMAVHARAHHAGQPERRGHVCDQCGGRYSTRGNLAAHARAAHRAPALPCRECGELFARRSDLRRHEARHGPPALRCAACPAAFHHADSLRRHRLAHRDVRPHCCPRCRRRFRQRSHLAAHRARQVCALLQTAAAD